MLNPVELHSTLVRKKKIQQINPPERSKSRTVCISEAKCRNCFQMERERENNCVKSMKSQLNKIKAGS